MRSSCTEAVNRDPGDVQYWLAANWRGWCVMRVDRPITPVDCCNLSPKTAASSPTCWIGRASCENLIAQSVTRRRLLLHPSVAS